MKARSHDQHFSHISLVMLFILQWTLGSNLSKDVLLLRIMQQKTSCSKATPEATSLKTPAYLSVKGLRLHSDVEDAYIVVDSPQ